MAEGRSNGAIAEKLVVTPRAVEKHVTNIFAKLGLRDAEKDPPPRARGAPLPRGLTATRRRSRPGAAARAARRAAGRPRRPRPAARAGSPARARSRAPARRRAARSSPRPRPPRRGRARGPCRRRRRRWPRRVARRGPPRRSGRS